ncbi:uncharacterized protein LOC143735213 isoform X1 [Siphateles boraxobius]|uniref:uncharacterized protein LOC143735213 isoform X1 n=1 Tax=Siphateles boraxobius TaxID=180520 RepID=UPI004063A06C
MKLFLNSIAVILILLDNGVFGVESDKVSVMEGDSVTLYTGVKTNQQEDIKWYFNDIRIADINGDLNKTCTDVQCNEGNERFRNRLKLDHQTGSLTIRNINTIDSGVYELKIISSRISGKIFNVSVHGVSAAERDKVKRKSVKEGESVTLYHVVIRKPSDVMLWYFNDIHIADTSGDQNKTCTDVQCKERFRDRLKLDHQTGSLTITNTRNTDSGEYKLQIIINNNSSFSITRVKRFNLTVIGSGLSSGAVAGICVGVLLVSAVVTAGVIYYRPYKSHGPVPQDAEGDADNPPPDPNDIPLEGMEHPGDADNPPPDPNGIPLENMDHPGDADNPPPNPNDIPLEGVEHPGDADNPPPDPNGIPLENMDHPGDADNPPPDPNDIPLEGIEHPGDADNPTPDPNDIRDQGV